MLTAGTSERVVEIITDILETERSTDDASHVPGSANEAVEDTAEHQYSNNALMDGIEFVSNQVKYLEDRMIDKNIASIQMKIDSIKGDVDEIKTTLKTFCGTIAALESYINTSAASHHSEVSQFNSALLAAVQLKEAIETKSGVRRGDIGSWRRWQHRIRVCN